MKRILLFLSCIIWSYVSLSQPVIVVKKGDARSLLDAIEEANRRNAEKDADRLYILIPNGFYDLGETVLTRISGHNVSLIGQSMEGVVEPDGRAVTLQDKGTLTICNRVRMLSYQDTYYSDNERCQSYMQDCEIHGTLDFICGAGDVWFEGCKIVTEKRTPDGSGTNIIAAPRTSETPWGYVFNHCTIENIVSAFNYGRTWHTNPRCVWMYTTLMTPEKLVPTRFDAEGMKVSCNYFKEYRTRDAQGLDITPKTNVVTFTLRDHTNPFVAETIMTKEEAKQYTLKNVFGEWQPAKVLKKLEKTSKKLKKHYKLN